MLIARPVRLALLEEGGGAFATVSGVDGLAEEVGFQLKGLIEGEVHALVDGDLGEGESAWGLGCKSEGQAYSFVHQAVRGHDAIYYAETEGFFGSYALAGEDQPLGAVAAYDAGQALAASIAG